MRSGWGSLVTSVLLGGTAYVGGSASAVPPAEDAKSDATVSLEGGSVAVGGLLAIPGARRHVARHPVRSLQSDCS
jgi:hypothetical protein